MKVHSPQRLTSNLAEINITPLVDVMLVLLIIFGTDICASERFLFNA